MTQKISNEEKLPVIVQMLDIIEGMPAGDFRFLSTVSNRLRMGEGKAGRFFYDGVGETMRSYCGSRMASKAVKLLVETRHSMEVVSQMVGYKSDKNQLARRTRSAYNMTPLQLRKTVKPEELEAYLFTRPTEADILAELEADAPTVVKVTTKKKELPGW